MTLNFNRLGYVSPFNQTACLLWQFVDNGIWYGALSLMFWASFGLISNGIFIQSCGQIYTESTILCGGICLYIDAPVWLQLYDSYIDYILPILLIPVCSITLVCRFLRQKQRLQQNVTWRQCRKMIIQITLISTVYMIFDIPAVIVFIVQVSGYSTFGSNIWFPYLARMTLVPSIIIPFATLLALPKLKDKLRNLCSWKHNQRAVFPGSTTN
ncbi:unnamed protein product [Adineta ricciae]|uniref:G-protein coupled receptors family 1 profile domain-containing protein n=1 Tax=Adineta ricciae TaxID=249248 RepID=A0A815E5U0_ADIRI|nr:unnamed protein product [Adineta ricciae]